MGKSKGRKGGYGRVAGKGVGREKGRGAAAAGDEGRRARVEDPIKGRRNAEGTRKTAGLQSPRMDGNVIWEELV